MKSLYSSNIMVLKCYKEAINIKNLFKNIGRISYDNDSFFVFNFIIDILYI